MEATGFYFLQVFVEIVLNQKRRGKMKNETKIYCDCGAGYKIIFNEATKVFEVSKFRVL